MFGGEINVEQYLLLDEALVQTAFMQWTLEDDEILANLCSRFIHRKLYKYVEMDHLDSETIDEIRRSFAGAGLHPDYDLEIDYPTDLPYDVFRPGEGFDSKQILLLDRHDKLREISEVSDIVRSISGIHRGRYHLYFPQDKLQRALTRLPVSIGGIFAK
ncbi:hypothetical protein D3C87_1606610 [compost metagenome]